MYKEYREMSRTDAVEALYQDMAARHRARFRSIHVRRLSSYKSNTISTNIISPDPQGCRDPKDCRYQTTVHQATSHQEPQISSSSPHCQEINQDHLLGSPAHDLQLRKSSNGQSWDLEVVKGFSDDQAWLVRIIHVP